MTIPVHNVEDAYIAALLSLDHRPAAEAVDLLDTDDIASPALQLVHQLIRCLCDGGIRPDPAAVLSLAISERHAVDQHQIHVFTKVVMRLIDHRAGNTPGSIRWYAAHALEQAWRSRTVEMATRLAQVAGHAEPDELDRLTCAEQAAFASLRARHRALVGLTRERVVAA